ncbi:hypothetical protein [Caballeronia glathei]|uniref:hypothetical protein n=1 Tax=Caballeronia glathei TaxID=60547 RepID=UPI001ABBCEF1|nr:hypothetical protein [Caballeronia glathei]
MVLIELSSRAVLGYHLSLRRECGAEDVLRAARCALMPWTPRELQFSDEAYVPGAGLPSYHHQQLAVACWNEFSVDGVLANICAHDGATIFGPSRFGKSCAVDHWLQRMLSERSFAATIRRASSGDGAPPRLSRTPSCTGIRPLRSRSCPVRQTRTFRSLDK